MLLNCIQKLAYDNNIRATTSVYVFKPKISNKDWFLNKYIIYLRVTST